MQFDTVKWVYVAGALPITTRGAVQPSPYNPLPAAGGGCGAPLVGLKLLARRQETPDVLNSQSLLQSRRRAVACMWSLHC